MVAIHIECKSQGLPGDERLISLQGVAIWITHGVRNARLFAIRAFMRPLRFVAMVFDSCASSCLGLLVSYPVSCVRFQKQPRTNM